MLRKLVLVRHGDAEFFGPEGTDASRRLTERGKAALVAAYPQTFEPLMHEADVHLWVSPATRALETAQAIRESGMAFASEEVHDSLYAQDDDAFLAELEAEGDGIVVAVGHIPFMERMLFELTGEDRSFSKGAVACVAFVAGDLRRGKLDWFAAGPSR